MPDTPPFSDMPLDTSGRLLAKTQAGDNAPPLSVSEISGQLKRLVEGEFGHVRVRGELSGVKVAASGHLYSCLKDENAVIDLVMWKTGVQRLAFRPEDGVEVIATGRLTTYPGRSKYQIVAESLEIAGEGALLALLEKLKAKLAGEGLFAAERKRALPYLPRVIGVVTSPTGAVIRDILHRLEDRCPTHVVVWPVRVQGEGAAQEVAAAVEGLNGLSEGGPIPRPDLIIVARGGGSIEDLWAFNEEAVVRAIAASAIPTISAVGHETDTSLADYAADRRAPTPTAAAEMAVPVRADLLAGVRQLGLRAQRAAAGRVTRQEERFIALSRLFPTPPRLLEPYNQRVDEQGSALDRALSQFVALEKQRFRGRADRLHPDLLRRRVARDGDRLAHLWARAVSPQRRLDQQRARLNEVGGWLRDAGEARHHRAKEALDRWALRLRPALVTDRIRHAQQRLDGIARVMGTLNPDNLLAKGYAMVLKRAAPGERLDVVTSASEARAKQRLTLRFADGTVDVATDDNSTPPPRSSRPREPKPAPPPQGGLFD